MDEDQSKFMKKIKEDPSVPIGIVGMLATLGYGAYRYKKARKVMSTSNFLMQLRVMAQGAVVGCMTVGMIYNLGKTFMSSQAEPKKIDDIP